MDFRSYHIITIGCQMNKADSERIAGVFEGLGFVECVDRKAADFVVLTTCGVRQGAEDRAYGLVGRIKKENPGAKIVLAGCLSEREDVIKRLDGVVDVWLPAREISNFQLLISKQFPISQFPNSINENLPSGGIQEPYVCDSDYLNIKPKYNSRFSAFVPIGNGCDNFCTYCVVPYARGREVYRPAGEIISEVKDLVKRGYREITLIAQNVNSYSWRIMNNELRIMDLENGKDGEGFDVVDFPKLLRMVNDIPGDFWVRFATSHPKDMSDDLIAAIAECDKVCKHVHLPAQAGDDLVLEKMNRKYTVEEYLELIGKIRGSMNNELRIMDGVWRAPVALTTDIIVGFPGESRGQFENTKKLFHAVRYDMAYIAQYSPRPGTAAAGMEDDVSPDEKKRREEELMKILRKTALENNRAYAGKTLKVLLEEKSRKGDILGRTETAKTVKVAGAREEMIGGFVKVKIDSVEDFGLGGTLIK